jgi:Family of unknown function (DUF5677)
MCNREQEVQFLKDEWDKANAWLSQLKFDRTDKSHVLGSGLAANAVEISYSMLCLFATDSDAAQMPLLRTLMEAGYRYLFLAQDPSKNIERLELEDLVERLKLMNGSCEIVPSTGALNEKRQVEQRKLVLEKGNVKNLSFFDIVGAVASRDNYSYYRVVSENTHATVSGILRTNIDLGVNETTEVFAYKQLKNTHVKFICCFSSQILQAIREHSDAIFRNRAN